MPTVKILSIHHSTDPMLIGDTEFQLQKDFGIKVEFMPGEKLQPELGPTLPEADVVVLMGIGDDDKPHEIKHGKRLIEFLVKCHSKVIVYSGQPDKAMAFEVNALGAHFLHRRGSAQELARKILDVFKDKAGAPLVAA